MSGILHKRPANNSSYKGHTNENYKLTSCLSNTDAYVFSGSEDGKIFAWDLVDGKVVERWQAHSKAVTSVEYHPKEDVLLSCCIDGTVKLWNTNAE